MPYTRAVKKLLRKMGKTMHERVTYGSEVERNAQIRSMLDRCLVDGQIGVILSGMDCDCTQYYDERVMKMPNSVQWFKRYWDEHCEWLDGPETQTFVPPASIVPQHRSYDLAMEAYENGHPSTVYLKDVSELQERR